MADRNSMTTAAAAGKSLTGAHADVLREAVRLALVEIMEGEVAEVAAAAPTSAPAKARATATATVSDASTRVSAAFRWRSRV
jgi:hypothetical protein